MKRTFVKKYNKFSIKPKNLEECKIISKWFDENWGSDNDLFYQNKLDINTYYWYGLYPGNVYYSFSNEKYPEITFEEFLNLTNQNQKIEIELW